MDATPRARPESRAPLGRRQVRQGPQEAPPGGRYRPHATDNEGDESPELAPKVERHWCASTRVLRVLAACARGVTNLAWLVDLTAAVPVAVTAAIGFAVTLVITSVGWAPAYQSLAPGRGSMQLRDARSREYRQVGRSIEPAGPRTSGRVAVRRALRSRRPLGRRSGRRRAWRRRATPGRRSGARRRAAQVAAPAGAAVRRRRCRAGRAS